MGSHQVRTCFVCRKEGQKGELLRFVWADPGEVVFDQEQRLPGRGAYLHTRVQCWTRCGEPKKWQHALFPQSQHRSGGGVAPRVTKENIERLVESIREQIEELAGDVSKSR